MTDLKLGLGKCLTEGTFSKILARDLINMTYDIYLHFCIFCHEYLKYCPDYDTGKWWVSLGNSNTYKDVY